jgi:hypothetical protein
MYVSGIVLRVQLGKAFVLASNNDVGFGCFEARKGGSGTVGVV